MKEFADSSALLGDGPALRERLRREGYVFMRNVAERPLAEQAGRQGLAALQAGGWLERGPEPMDAPVTLPVRANNVIDSFADPAFRRFAVSEAFNRLPYQPKVESLMHDLAGPQAFVYPLKFPRIVYPDGLVPNYRGNRVHRDYLLGAAQDMFTMWMPLMDIPVELGGLAVKQGSTADPFRLPTLVGPAEDGWVTTNYKAGDLLIFHCFTYHASLPNHTADRLRLSGEFRWQLSDIPVSPSMVFGPRGNDGFELYSRLFSRSAWWHPVPDGLVFTDRSASSDPSRGLRPGFGVNGVRALRDAVIQQPPPSRFVPLPTPR